MRYRGCDVCCPHSGKVGWLPFQRKKSEEASVWCVRMRVELTIASSFSSKRTVVAATSATTIHDLKIRVAKELGLDIDPEASTMLLFHRGVELADGRLVWVSFVRGGVILRLFAQRPWVGVRHWMKPPRSA
jgi:hypothetical protein